jgi:hypothetical protein
MNNYKTINEIISCGRPYHKAVIHKSLKQVIDTGLVMWCVNNVSCGWTILCYNEFLFEDGQEATNFVLKFS